MAIFFVSILGLGLCYGRLFCMWYDGFWRFPKTGSPKVDANVL